MIDKSKKEISSYDDFFVPFHSSEKPEKKFRIGAEMEKFGVFRNDGSPLPYEGERSVLSYLHHLSTYSGYVEEYEYEGGPLLSLVREKAEKTGELLRESITLEPGGQFELSGAAHSSIHAIATEFFTHMDELENLSSEFDVAWLGLGFHPFSTRQDYQFVPKQRYSVMRQYLPTKGEYGLDMMLRTSTVQANYDYSSEQDAIKKLQVALKLAPLTTALFANSPFYEATLTQNQSYRARTWLDVDNSRAGLIPVMWKKDARYIDYIEWALDVPMFMFKRGGVIKDNRGQSFRNFWTHGFDGFKPTIDDWEMHLNTLFPEVRLKRTLEIRGADAQNGDLLFALQALWTGLFYDQKSLDEAYALTENFDACEAQELRTRLWQHGLQATFKGQKLTFLAERVLELSRSGLQRRKLLSGEKDESVYLDGLSKLVEMGQTPADELRLKFSKAAAAQGVDERDIRGRDFVQTVLSLSEIKQAASSS